MPQLLNWLLVLILLSGCSAFSAKDNAEPPAELVEFTPTLQIETLWDISLKGANGKFISIRPVLRDEQLFVAEPDGRVLAVDAASGKRVWKSETGAPLTAGPGIVGDLVLLGTGEAELIALERETGEESWRRRVSSEVLSSPVGESGTAVVRSIDGRVLGMNAATGETRWSFDRRVPVLTLRGDSSLLIHDGRVLLGFANGKLVSLALATGNLVWETAIGTPHGRTELERVVDIDADPVLVEGVVYGACFNDGVAAVSESSGVVLWKRELSTHAGLDADWRQLYITDAEDHVWSLDASNGATLWQQDVLHARRLSAPAIIGEYIVVGDYEGYLHWLAQEDGRLLARVRVGNGRIRIQPLVVDDVVYIFDDKGRLAALRAKPKEPDSPEKADNPIGFD